MTNRKVLRRDVKRMAPCPLLADTHLPMAATELLRLD